MNPALILFNFSNLIKIILLCFEQVKTLLQLYAKEKYILTVNQQARDFKVFISFKVCTRNFLGPLIWMLCLQLGQISNLPAGRSYKFVSTSKCVADVLAT